jgi:hypothetical protein
VASLTQIKDSASGSGFRLVLQCSNGKLPFATEFNAGSKLATLAIQHQLQPLQILARAKISRHRCNGPTHPTVALPDMAFTTIISGCSHSRRIISAHSPVQLAAPSSAGRQFSSATMKGNIAGPPRRIRRSSEPDFG